MPLFFAKYKVLDEAREMCMHIFLSMSEQDDARDMGPQIRKLGRWNLPGECSGFMILEAPNAIVIQEHLYNWIALGNIQVTPVCDDNAARQIILKSNPPYRVDYSATNDEPRAGETLFAIEWEFLKSKRLEGYQAFASMTEEQDKADQGNNRFLGRWHDLGTGRGFAICGSNCEADIFAGVGNWVGLCDIVVKPVLTDTQIRGAAQSNPEFATKASAILSSMGKTYVEKPINVPALYETLAPNKGLLFGIKYQVLEPHRETCSTFFGLMDETDDALEFGVNLKKHGRWHRPSESRGHLVVEAPNFVILAKMLYKWTAWANIEVFPICDDNTARSIILKDAPSYVVDYSHKDDEPIHGESLFVIEWKFNPESRLEGLQAFANMTQEQDKADAGNNRPLGRWHNIGTGTGFAICASKSVSELQAWASNWSALCSCEIHAVLTDKQARAIEQSKPNFATKGVAVMEATGNTYVSKQTTVPALGEKLTANNGQLFGVKYQINNSARDSCMTLFATMTEEDDVQDFGPNIKKHGRWNVTSECCGFVVLEAPNAAIIYKHLSNWVSMATIEVFPLVDDNAAREIILKKKPKYTVDYKLSNDEPGEGESLYVIEWKFHRSKVLDGFNAFANMTLEQDKVDSGNNRALGRWHNIGTGTGFAIAASKSEADIEGWASNWAGICDCEIRPVLTDRQARELVRVKPDFASKASALMKAMGRKYNPMHLATQEKNYDQRSFAA